VLLDEAGRERLAERVNAAVDLPLLSEAQERALFGAAADALGAALDRLIPAAWRPALQGATAAEIAAFKQSVVAELGGWVPLPGLAPDCKQTWLCAAVDFAFDAFLDNTSLDGVVLAPEAQLQRLDMLIESARGDVLRAQRQGVRRQATLQRRVDNLVEERNTIQRQVGGRSYGLYACVAASVVLASLVSVVSFR